MKILMVCLGNICRSPMAEGVLKKMLLDYSTDSALPANLHAIHTKFNLTDWYVDSAGIGGWHEGELPDHRAIRTAGNHNVHISDQRARQIRKSDFEDFDVIVVMDLENYRDALRLAQNRAHQQKINLLLDFKYPGQNRSVPDPYYSDRFEECFDLITEGCRAFLDQILASKVPKKEN